MPNAEDKVKKRQSGRNWEGVDFSLNKAFWRSWGHDAALPFRVANLKVVQRTLADFGVLCGLYGNSLRDVLSFSELRENPGDDVAVNVPLPEVLEILSRELPSDFTVIGSNAETLSVERWGRYINVHHHDLGPLKSTRIHGENIQIPANEKDGSLAEYREHSVRSAETALRIRNFFRRLIRLSRSVLSEPGLTITLLIKMPFQASVRAANDVRYTIKLLSLHWFLNLQLDDATALNWSWRGEHLKQVASPGLSFGQLLGSPMVAGEVLEVDMSRTHEEPIHLSRSFWKGGNNFFLYPYLYGFRHLVVPYHACNLYIRRIAAPMLYSAEYFESLTPMSEQEIEKFLSSRPLEVESGASIRGKHRAIAMLGRISRGESYIPMPATVRRRFFD